MFNDAATRAAVEGLTREDFFNIPLGRTLTRCTKWVVDVLRGAKTVSLRDAVAEGVAAARRERQCECPEARACASCMEATAATYLCASGLVPAFLRKVDDVPDACNLIHASSSAQLLTDPVLRQMCDLAPGGARLFDTVGADRLRAALQDDGRLGPEILGHDAVIPYLGSGVRYEALERANSLLTQADDVLYVIREAVELSIDQEEQERFRAFRSELGSDAAASLSLPLFLPRRHAVVAALRALADTPAAKAKATTLHMLIEALDASRSRGKAECELREVVWYELLGATKLPASDLDGDTNRRRMEALFGVFPHQHTLQLYPELRRTVRGAMDRGRPTGTCAPSPQPAALPAMTVAECLQVVEDHVAAYDRMPHHSELDDALLAAIEAATGVTFTSWIEHLSVLHGIKRNTRSNNERRLDLIAGKLFGSRVISHTEEWSCSETFGAAYRIDTRLLLSGPRRTELFLEADGEGHFGQVRNWNLQATCKADKAKATALRKRIHARRDAGEDGMLLMVHHGLLTGPEASRFGPEQLAQVIAAAEAEQAWWVYVRPAGSRDMRACPSRNGRGRRLRSPELDDTVEVFVLTW